MLQGRLKSVSRNVWSIEGFNVNSNPWRDIGYSWSVIHSGNVEKCSPKYFQEKGFFAHTPYKAFEHQGCYIAWCG